MVALSTRPPSRSGNGGTSVPPPAKLTRSGALARITRMTSDLGAERAARAGRERRGQHLGDEGQALQEVAAVEPPWLLRQPVEPLEPEALDENRRAPDLAGHEAERDAAGDEPRVRAPFAQADDEALLLGEPQADEDDVGRGRQQRLVDAPGPGGVVLEPDRRGQ